MAYGHINSPSPVELAARLPAAFLNIDRIAELADRFTGKRQQLAIRSRSQAANRVLTALERRIVDTAPRSIGDVVAQLVLLRHEIGEATETSGADARHEINAQLHRAIVFLAAAAGVDVRDIGGDQYLIHAYLGDAR